MSAVTPLAPVSVQPIDRFLSSVSHEMIDIVFQPIVDLDDGSAMGYEILSRPRGIVEPIANVFDRARETESSWSLEVACWSAAFREISVLGARFGTVKFFVNLSPTAISAERALELVRHASSVAPASVIIEVTEQESITDHEMFALTVAELAACGFRFAIDDFGAGHNGLRTLVATRPEFVKLDLTLTRHLAASPYQRSVVGAMVELTRTIGAVLVAEGVETWEDVEVLRDIGVTRAQGFLLGRPSRHPVVLAREVRQRLTGVEGVSTA